jgi:4-amino-4-deoxy-L-arabinose transferase-like glycosyltransferase
LRVAAFVIVFLTYLVYLRGFGDSSFYYDSLNYWALGDTFGTPGHFSLVDFNSDIRGYALPLFNHVLASTATTAGIGDVSVVQIFGSLEVALLGVVLIPRLVRALWPAACVTTARVLLFNGVVFIFWRDHLGFPLSDFPAATLALTGVLAVSRRSPLGYVLAGLTIGLAWNVRQAYFMMLLFVLVLVVVRAAPRRAPLRALRNVGLVLAGVLVVSIPQMLINHHQAGSWSPTVRETRDVTLGNLSQGLRAQRYETYVGTGTQSPSVRYADPSTQAVLRQEGLTKVGSYSQYARIVERHPAEMVAAWARRIFNGLDVRYSTPYIHDLGATSEWLSLLDYTLLFAALARLLLPAFRRSVGKVGWPEALALCCACIPAIPCASEPRYYLPLQLVLYSVVLFGAGTRSGWSALGRSGQIALVIVYPAFLLACVTLSTSTVALIVRG